ncbi:Photosystem I assembly protein Ycf3 [Mesonia oceanica]|uniref:Photosystem I assembly protein Ycf3 n=1 Tax=Mesonia oceanica TaxID=2687242 RepID=A0AC61Y9Y3_9FLAO|nr:Photosystem I assembly protein Ycf3 [Mesonia oceanica]|tara:strand:+ start:1264 stop:2304 length:1041 start_codon:yes stop_codon:yes gene_type:complete
MKRIRSSDFALLLISDNYLKSKNCLYEILELQKDDNHWDKVLPIVCEETKIYTAFDRIKYINFWEKKTIELETALKTIDPINSTELYKDLKLFKDISFNIDRFLKLVSESLHFKPEEIIDKKYKPIIDKFGLGINAESLISLLNIYLITDLEKREIALDNYIDNHKESGYYYSIKGSTSRDLSKFDQAIHYYKKGLAIEPNLFTILNNYGQIAQHVKKDFKKAKELYEKAVLANPKSDIARLNLGVLLKQEFNDVKGAEEQYNKILEFDPKNAKAHNNISNIYKDPSAKKVDLEKAEYHLVKAIESNPNYIEALLSYGNFLKVYKKEMNIINAFKNWIKKVTLKIY